MLYAVIKSVTIRFSLIISFMVRHGVMEIRIGVNVIEIIVILVSCYGSILLP